MRLFAIACASALLLASGCGNDADHVAEVPPLEDGANVILYVSNQSFERPEVDITIEIDGKPVVSDAFPVENQHNWVQVRLVLERGKHVLRATSKRGDAEIRRVFRVAGKRSPERWLVVDYWCCDDARDPRFTFDVAKEPIAFA